MDAIWLALKKLLMDDVVPLKQNRESRQVPENVVWIGENYHEFARHLNIFSARLFPQWEKSVSGNGCFSALAIWLMLRILLEGAGGKTKTSLMEILGKAVYLSSPDFMLTLLNALEKADKKAGLKIFSSFWFHHGIIPSRDFLDFAKESGIEGGVMNFGHEGATDRLNLWLREASDAGISDGPALLRSNILLLQGLKPGGAWKFPFERLQTESKSFFPEKGSMISCPMMKGRGVFNRIRTSDFESILLPLGNGMFSFALIMPDENRRLEDISGSITGGEWLMARNEAGTELTIEVPVFSINIPTDFRNILRESGMKDAFDPDKADFEAISEEPLWLDQVLQYTPLSLHELGIGESLKARMPENYRRPGRNKVDMTFNRPFYFSLIENETGMILLQGKLMQPQPSE